MRVIKKEGLPLDRTKEGGGANRTRTCALWMFGVLYGHGGRERQTDASECAQAW